MSLRIGISARLLHQPPPGLGLPLKRLQFLESNMAQWIMSHGAVALMIPFIDKRVVPIRRRPPLNDIVDNLDGLVLQGGSDICASTYGAKPWREHTDSDPIRDEYELELLRGFIDAGKPVLGICRGAQLLNVYFATRRSVSPASTTSAWTNSARAWSSRRAAPSTACPRASATPATPSSWACSGTPSSTSMATAPPRTCSTAAR